MVLLAGGLKASPLAAAIRAPVVTLPLGASGTVLGRWAELVSACAEQLAPGCVVQLCVGKDQEGLATQTADAASCVAPIEVWVDAEEFRGPAGVVRDATAALPPSATVLVVEASRVPLVSLSSFVERHFKSGADVTVGVNPDGSPAGVFLFEESMFANVPEVGFMDLKEQFLARLRAAGKDVRVFTFPEPGVFSCRTRAEFVRAAMLLADQDASVQSAASPGPAVLSEGAAVDPTAYVSHCVIGTAARVSSGAVVVRSVVMGGAVVPTGASISDSVITPTAVIPDIE